MASYPDSLPAVGSFTMSSTGTLGAQSHSTVHNGLAAEVVAITTELGVDPKGVYSTVAARLTALATGGADGSYLATVTVGTASITYATITNLTATNITLSAFTNLAAVSLTVASANITYAAITNVTVTSLTIGSAVPNLTATSLQVSNAVPNLTVTSLKITNAVSNITATALTVTNQIPTLTISAVSITNANVTNLTISALTFAIPMTNLTSLSRSSIGVSFDGSGSAISSGTKAYIVPAYNITINSWEIVSSTSGSIYVDIGQAYQSTFAGTVSSLVSTGTKVSIDNAGFSVTGYCFGWAVTSLTAGSIMEIKVTAATTCVLATVQLFVTRW